MIELYTAATHNGMRANLALAESPSDLAPRLPQLEIAGHLMSGDASSCVGVEQVVARHKLLVGSRVKLFANARSLSDLGRRYRKSAPARTVFAAFAAP